MPKSRNKGTPSKPMAAISTTALENEFEAHLGFLRKSITEFDAGDMTEFRRLASTLRVLLHRTKNSKPAVDHIGLDDQNYVSYAVPLNDKNILTEMSLALIRHSNRGAEYLPVLDQGPSKPRNLTLDDWKAEPVLRDDQRQEFTRWELILIVANKLGSHVDNEIDQKYHRLANENSIGWIMKSPDGETPILDLEKVYVRHIAWEALVSLELKWRKLLGNRRCNCGSGRKARYCCMKLCEKQSQPTKPNC